MDLRIKKTQKALVTAMFTLLEEQGFNKITVNDLCTEALVSRSAFYSHFEDKYDLLKFCIQTVKETLFEQKEEGDYRSMLRELLEKTNQNSRMIKNLMLSGFDLELIEIIRQSFNNGFSNMLKRHQVDADKLPAPVEVVSLYYSSGITNVIMYWIGNNMPYSVDEIAGYLMALISNILGKEGCKL